jgi:hypothetical protein
MLNTRFIPQTDDIVVLLDVNNKALIKDGALNPAFFDALLQYNLNDIYLFSDTDLTSDSLLAHAGLWTLLLERGFYVHASLTPSDLLWNEVGRSKRPTLPSHLTFSSQEPGAALKDAINNAIDRNKDTISPAHEAKSLLIRQELARQSTPYPHPIKGLMLNLFLSSCPPKTKRVLLFEDNPAAIETFDHFAPLSQKIIVPPLAVFPLTSTKTSKEEYEKMILMHPVIAINAIREAIDNEIDKLLYDSNPFMSSNKEKLDTLKNLYTLFEKNKTVGPLTVNTLIDDFLKNNAAMQHKRGQHLTNQQTLSHQRNIFWTDKHKKLTHTMQLIKDIKDSFGKVIMPSSLEQSVVPSISLSSERQTTFLISTETKRHPMHL